jgi:hypothetical protein
VVPVFAAGYDPQQADFTTWWQNPALFFQYGIVARVSETITPTTLPSTGVATTIGFDTVAEDPYSGFNSTTAAWTPPAGYSGWYQVTLTVFSSAPVANLVTFQPQLAGSSTYTRLQAIEGSSATSRPVGCSATFGVYLFGGVSSVNGQCRVLNSASNVVTGTTAGQNSTMEITWLTQH